MMDRYRNFSVDFLLKFLFSRKAGALIKIISWLSVVGIGTGVASLILVLSVMNGFNRSIRERKFSVEPHLVAYFDQMSLEQIHKHAGWEWLKRQSGFQSDISETQDVVLRTTDGFVQGAVAQGVSRETLEYILSRSEKFRDPDIRRPLMELRPGEILVGGGVGDIMGLFENDQLVVISPESLLGPRESFKKVEMVRVKDFLRTDVDEIDSQKIIYILGETLVQLRNTASLERVVEIRLPDPENYAAAKSHLESLGLRVDSWKERNSNLFYSLKLEKFVVGLLLGLSTLIASFSLVTVMVLLLTQKRKDIGLLLAMGFVPVQLKNVFVRIGVYLSVLGIVGGAALGITLSLLVGKYSSGLLPNIYSETNIPSEIHGTQVLIVFIVALIMSYMTTWLSIRKIADWQPVQALKGF